MKSFGIVVVLVTCIFKITAEPPKREGKQEDFTGLSDFFRSITCNVVGKGLTYEWFHNGVKVESASSMFLMFGGIIVPKKNPVTEDYQGTYQCKASNDDGTLWGPKIKVAFTIVGTFQKSDDSTETVNATVGRDLRLKCPPRTLSQNVYYHWGGRQGVTGAWFMPNKKHYMIMEDGSLLFASVKDEDIEYFNVQMNGVSCSIESKGDTKRLSFSQRFLLKETGAKNTVPFGPTIKTTLKDRDVVKGTEFVVLRCGAVGLPTPDYSWTVTGFDGIEKAIVSGKDGYQLQDFNHILMIKSIEIKHDGWYKCIAKSTYGGKENVDEVRGRISVKGKPQWAQNGKIVDVFPTEGGSFRWLCKAFGNPDPSYTWLFNGVKLSSNDSYDIDGGIITFQSISKENEGLYQCLAENDFGSISSSAVLKPKPVPTTPPPPKCNISKLNIMFLVDGSGSVPVSTFREFKQFMQLLVKRFTIGPNDTHIGALQYCSKPRTALEFELGKHQTAEAVQEAISKIIYHYGAYTFAGNAMRIAKELIMGQNRRPAKNVMILLMDNGTWDKREARKQSQELREKGTQIIILDTTYIMHEIADMGLKFTSDKLRENVDIVAQDICK